MKLFDLEAAKRGEPICKGTGATIRFIGLRSDGALVAEEQSGKLEVYLRHHVFMAPKKRTVWVNLYEVVAYRYDSEVDADSDAQDFTSKRIGGKAYPVEIEE